MGQHYPSLRACCARTSRAASSPGSRTIFSAWPAPQPEISSCSAMRAMPCAKVFASPAARMSTKRFSAWPASGSPSLPAPMPRPGSARRRAWRALARLAREDGDEEEDPEHVARVGGPGLEGTGRVLCGADRRARVHAPPPASSSRMPSASMRFAARARSSSVSGRCGSRSPVPGWPSAPSIAFT